MGGGVGWGGWGGVYDVPHLVFGAKKAWFG